MISASPGIAQRSPEIHAFREPEVAVTAAVARTFKPIYARENPQIPRSPSAAGRQPRTIAIAALAAIAAVATTRTTAALRCK